MSQALTQYGALYGSLMSRRRKAENLKGLDKLVGWASMRLRHRKARLAWLMSEARAVDTLRGECRGFSEAVLDDQVMEIRARFVRGKVEREELRRALALVREVARRETGEEAFLVQLVGALGLYHGRIVEMLTGEGKTLAGSIAAPLLAWRHRHIHILTVNDYLARRDAQSRAGIYKRCNCSVGAIQEEQPPQDRYGIYAKSIVYGTPKQITADYLRDQLRVGPMRTPWTARMLSSQGSGPMIPGLRAAIVDEADAVLIDEGVVPLIIARNRQESEMADVYRDACRIAEMLDEGPDFTIEHVKRKATLKRRGRERAQSAWERLDAPIWKAKRRAEELVRQALVARACYKRGSQYEIIDGRVIIVDENTGRFLHDRNWEHGLHQSVEAKEGVDVTADRETLARLSFQRFFRTYRVLSGMTGTVADSKREMEQVYERPVTKVPTNRPLIRKARPTQTFRNARDRWEAVLEEIVRLHEIGRPVLVGTRSISTSEMLSARLETRGVEHRVLNATQHAEEASMIALAGRSGAVTVATNMAGRGTDIILDPKARELGGLAVILTEMHGAKRIDRQFIGRAGRQGDPGSSQIFTSLEDELIQHHAPRLARVLAFLPGSARLTARRTCHWAFRHAQRRSESRDRRNRAAVLRQDDWIEKHLPGG